MGKIKIPKIFCSLIILAVVWCDQLEDVLERLDHLEEQNDFLLEKVEFLEAQNNELRADYEEIKDELHQLQVNFYRKRPKNSLFSVLRKNGLIVLL